MGYVIYGGRRTAQGCFPHSYPMLLARVVSWIDSKLWQDELIRCKQTEVAVMPGKITIGWAIPELQLSEKCCHPSRGTLYCRLLHVPERIKSDDKADWMDPSCENNVEIECIALLCVDITSKSSSRLVAHAKNFSTYVEISPRGAVACNQQTYPAPAWGIYSCDWLRGAIPASQVLPSLPTEKTLFSCKKIVGENLMVLPSGSPMTSQLRAKTKLGRFATLGSAGHYLTKWK